MAALIKNIETVLKYMKVTFINSSSSLPDFEAVQYRFIEPVLGIELLNTLEGEESNEEPSQLAQLVFRSIIPLAYWQDLPLMHVQIGDKGLGTFTSDNQTPVHRWEFEKLSDMLEAKGCLALEQLFKYLNSNTDDLDWTKPDQYKIIFPTGDEFNRYFTISQPFRTFENIRTCVREAENRYIRPLIGSDFFEYLRDRSQPTNEETEVIKIIKMAVANLAIKIASEILPVKITSEGFTVSLQRNTDAPDQGQQQAPNTNMSVLRNSTLEAGNSYLGNLKSFLNSNASTALYPLYFNSSYYEAPQILNEQKPLNESTHNFFM